MYSKEEAKQLKKDFWDGFGRYSRRLKYLKQQNKKWILYNTGIKHLELKFYVERNHMGVMMEVNHRSESTRIEIYSQLDMYKKIIEETFGAPLTWDYLFTNETGKEVCRIYTQTEGFDYHKKENWPEMYEYMANNMIQMERAFKEVKDFIQLPETL